MNDTFINYVEEMLDIAERNNIFCLTPRAFSEFSTEVREVLEKQVPRKVDTEMTEIRGAQHFCETCCGSVGYLHEYCENCGQKLDWEED